MGPGARQVNQTCVAPATCVKPPALYSRVMPVPSRAQWTDDGGYCGALSIQAIAQSFGAWISQDQARKAVGPGIGGHGVRCSNVHTPHRPVVSPKSE